MSLDVYLEGDPFEVDCTCTQCWNDHKREERHRFFDRNITHNLGAMAREAGIYEALWRPDENGVTKASQLIKPLENGIELLESDPKRFLPLNPSNGWGNYEGLVEFVRDYLEACRNNPDANVRVSR